MEPPWFIFFGELTRFRGFGSCPCCVRLCMRVSFWIIVYTIVISTKINDKFTIRPSVGSYGWDGNWKNSHEMHCKSFIVKKYERRKIRRPLFENVFNGLFGKVYFFDQLESKRFGSLHYGRLYWSAKCLTARIIAEKEPPMINPVLSGVKKPSGWLWPLR